MPPGRAGDLAFVAALAVHDAVGELAPNMVFPLTLKWPNDVQVGNAKFAGILIEAENSWAVIGVGINCAHHPAQMPNVTDLKSSGIAVSLEQLFAALSKHMLIRLQQWEMGKGFAAIRGDWLGACSGVGHPILVRLPTQELTGKFENIDDKGHLMLRLPTAASKLLRRAKYLDSDRAAKGRWRDNDHGRPDTRTCFCSARRRRRDRHESVHLWAG